MRTTTEANTGQTPNSLRTSADLPQYCVRILRSNERTFMSMFVIHYRGRESLCQGVHDVSVNLNDLRISIEEVKQRDIYLLTTFWS